MDKTIKNISRDIRSGRLLEENIPQLFNYLVNHYQTNALVRLAMHYYAFYEAYCDEEGTWSRQAKDAMTQLNHIIGDAVLGNVSGAEREKAVKEVDALRKEITDRMDALTTYTDIFQIYEYVLNRLEYRFKGEVSSMDEEEFSKEVLRYIFDSEDNFIINEKIKEIIGQLPIRMTKQKYFELLKESLNSYLGGDRSSLNTYLYMIRTSAMLYRDKDMDKLYPGLWEKKEALSRFGYKEMLREDFDKAEGILHAATLILETETNVYFGLMEIVNEVYALLLCQAYAGMVPSTREGAVKAAFSSISEINAMFLADQKEDLPADLIELFTDLEGVQEELSYEIDIMEDALYEVSHNHKALTASLMLDPLLNVLQQSKNLLSNSLFMNFDGTMESETVDEVLLAREAGALEQELVALFDAQDRMVGRAVMANTINKMPVFFNNHSEVMEYVRYSLSRCSDKYEKAACIEIINVIMAE